MILMHFGQQLGILRKYLISLFQNMPGLQSFCVCTAIGLGSIYLLQVSWFVAWMSLDESRVIAGRNGLLPCIIHKQHQLSKNQEKSPVSRIYSKMLSSLVFKVLTVIASVACLVLGVWGWSEMRQEFDITSLLPSDSYLRKWVHVYETDYQDNGYWDAEVYSGHLSHKDLSSIDKLVIDLETLRDEKLYLRDVDSWWTKMKEFSDKKTNYTTWHQFANEEDFPIVLSDFLFSSYGSQYKPNFKFESDLICNEPAPRIQFTKFKLGYVTLDGPEEHIPARAAVTEVIRTANSPYTFSHSNVYAPWETDQIIGYELWRNIALAMLCVFCVTLLLLCNIQICIMVIIIVVCTLTDVVGFLHFWGITIDVISCINIVLAVGLCVDYSVHVGHAFLVSAGCSTIPSLAYLILFSTICQHHQYFDHLDLVTHSRSSYS